MFDARPALFPTRVSERREAAQGRDCERQFAVFLRGLAQRTHHPCTQRGGPLGRRRQWAQAAHELVHERWRQGVVAQLVVDVVVSVHAVAFMGRA